MNKLLSMLMAGMILAPVGAMAGGRHEGDHRGGDRHGGWSGNHWGHERHEGWRGNGGRFRGWNGTFYGEIIILDDGCYFWNGLFWELTYNCD